MYNTTHIGMNCQKCLYYLLTREECVVTFNKIHVVEKTLYYMLLVHCNGAITTGENLNAFVIELNVRKLIQVTIFVIFP